MRRTLRLAVTKFLTVRNCRWMTVAKLVKANSLLIGIHIRFLLLLSVLVLLFTVTLSKVCRLKSRWMKQLVLRANVWLTGNRNLVLLTYVHVSHCVMKKAKLLLWRMVWKLDTSYLLTRLWVLMTDRKFTPVTCLHVYRKNLLKLVILPVVCRVWLSCLKHVSQKTTLLSVILMVWLNSVRTINLNAVSWLILKKKVKIQLSTWFQKVSTLLLTKVTSYVKVTWLWTVTPYHTISCALWVLRLLLNIWLTRSRRFTVCKVWRSITNTLK